MEQNSQIRPLYTLSSLRFFAAYAVVALHLLPRWLGVSYWELPSIFTNFLGLAYIGMPFFYALSGFVLYYAYHNQSLSNSTEVITFLAKRFARLAPIFYFSLLLGAPFFLEKLTAEFGTDKGMMKAVLYFFGNLGFLSAWFPKSLGFNFPTWSISVEMFCYLSFPLWLKYIKKFSCQQASAGLSLCFFSGATIQLIGLFIFPELFKWPWSPGNLRIEVTDFFQLHPLVHAPEFIFGIFLARLWEIASEKKQRYADACLTFGSLLLILVLQCGYRWPYLMMTSFLFLPIHALFIWGGAGKRGKWSKWLEHPFLILLGNSSYCLYALHIPLSYWYDKIIPNQKYASILLFLFFIPFISVMVHLYAEKPLINRLNEILRKKVYESK